MGKSKEEKEKEALIREEAKRVKKVMEEVSKYLQSEIKTVEGKTKEKSINYFSGAEVVDLLMCSSWTEDNPDLYLQTRSDAVEFSTGLLTNEYFIALRLKNKRKLVDIGDSSKSKKKSKPLKFEVINDADEFLDSPENFYMWKYSPMGNWAYIIGFCLLFGVVALALVPVWPGEAQIAFQYLTTGSGIFVGVFIVLLIIRLITFVLVWALSKGVYHFWILPNINEDRLGILETLKPLYSLDNYYEEKERKEKRRKRRELREQQISGSELVSSCTEDKKIR